MCSVKFYSSSVITLRFLAELEMRKLADWKSCDEVLGWPIP